MMLNDFSGLIPSTAVAYMFSCNVLYSCTLSICGFRLTTNTNWMWSTQVVSQHVLWTLFASLHRHCRRRATKNSHIVAIGHYKNSQWYGASRSLSVSLCAPVNVLSFQFIRVCGHYCLCSTTCLFHTTFPSSFSRPTTPYPYQFSSVNNQN